MGRAKVSVDRLADTIRDELEAYQQEKTEELKKSIRNTAKVCCLEIKQASPDRTGGYRKGWGVKVLYEDMFDIRAAVYNRTDYQLTHLLEYGHDVKRNGKVIGRSAAYPHIKQAEQHAIDDLEKNVKMIWSNSGKGL